MENIKTCNSRRGAIAATALTALLPLASFAGANLIKNGTFEGTATQSAGM